MLMKYKDFKGMSQNEMKKIMGGDPPGGQASCDIYNCGGCPSNCQCENKPHATVCVVKPE
jgi:bacteriocin-like protein